MKIRNATMDDLDAIADVESECFPKNEAATREQLQARLKAYPNHFWLLENDEGRVVSFVDGMTTDLDMLTDEMYENAAMHDESGAWQMIFGVNTLPEYRGRGCAAALLKCAIATAATHGRRGLVLTCKDELMHYYAKFGFKDEGISSSTHGGVVWHDMRLEFPKA